jgi:F-type H+-transporting ATPase subunit delta
VRQVPRALVNRYAQALFGAARDLDVLDAVRGDIDALSAAMRDNPELPLLLANPRLSREKVRGILRALADKVRAADLTRNFLNLLVDKDRLEILGALGGEFDRLWRDFHGEIEVRVATAVPVSDALRGAIHAHLKGRSGRTPLIQWETDPSLLGGIVIAWPDRVFDGSLARKLENLKAQLALGA